MTLQWSPMGFREVDRPMHILFVTPYVPSPIRTRPFNLIKHLAASHDVELVTLAQSRQEREEALALGDYCSAVRTVFMPRWQSLCNCVRALPGPTPMQAAYCRSAGMEEAITRAIVENSQRRFDVMHVEHLRAARYGWASTSIPAVFDSVDCISLLMDRTVRQNGRLARRLVGLLEADKTRRYEGLIIRRYPRVLVTSDADRNALLKMEPRSDIQVLTNGVDLDYFHPPGIAREERTLVFSGKMSYHANEEAVLYFCRQILPLIWHGDDRVRLVIAGSAPSGRIRALAGDPRITVTGYVDDMRRYIGGAALAVCPMVYGVGIQNKVLEAMAMGTPVVATSQAASALSAEAKERIAIADSPRDFASSVLGLLKDRELRLSLGNAGRRYVEEFHDWKRTTQKLVATYEEVRDRWQRQNAGSMPGRPSSQPVLMGRRE